VKALSAQQLARVDALLDELLELPVETRPSVLDRKCPDDAAVRAEVGSLLSAAGVAGAWRITQRIGRGGMGVVYEAERAESDFLSASRSRCSDRRP
jgi:hypothetical protein